MDHEKQKPTKITKWIEIHQSQGRTQPFDPSTEVSTTLIDGSKNSTIDGDFNFDNFRFHVIEKYSK